VRQTQLLAWFGAVAIAVSGAAAPATADPAVIGKTWLIESVAGLGTIDTAQTRFEISSDGGVASTIGCNRMMGHATFAGTALSIGPIATTRMACPPALMAQEQAYAAALEKTKAWKLEGSMLVLSDAGGSALVRLVPRR
jgi:putative lipoprotein